MHERGLLTDHYPLPAFVSWCLNVLLNDVLQGIPVLVSGSTSSRSTGWFMYVHSACIVQLTLILQFYCSTVFRSIVRSFFIVVTLSDTADLGPPQQPIQWLVDGVQSQ